MSEQQTPRKTEATLPVTPPEASTHGPAPKDGDKGLERFKVWEKYEEVAMHFNDLLIRLRTQSLAGVAALAGLVTIILRGDVTPNLRWGVMVWTFCLLVLFWAAIWILDFKYYNRLLRGAVNALLEIEGDNKSNEPLSGLLLSTRIEEAVTNKPKCSSRKQVPGVFFFYVVVLGSLLLGLAVSVCGFIDLEVVGSFTSRPGVEGIVENARTGTPIEGAMVTVLSSTSSGVTIATKTTANGMFLIPPKRKLGIHFVPTEPAALSVTLTVQADGYQPVSNTFAYSILNGFGTTNFQKIPLKPITR